jgi:uncharacterized membrane protein YgcG
MMMRNIAIALVVLVFSGFGWAQTGERILEFDSTLEVDMDGSLTVTENIRVVCRQDKIERGIYRDFPTRYKATHGRTVNVGFDVLEVRRDGNPEPFHIKNTSNGKRIYFGHKDVRLSPGEYTYSLIYRTHRQLGYFDTFDELYWNVTGNDWQFMIEKARARVILPADTQVVQKTAYTGIAGARGQDFSTGMDDFGNPTFQTTRALNPGEGLTIAVGWPKGVVREPTRAQKFSYFLRDSLGAAVALLGLLIVFGYYFNAWQRVGRDPQKGTIIPLFHPPKGISPGAARYIMEMGYDHKSFAAAVVHLAVKGAISIRNEDDTYELEILNADPPDLSTGERKILKALFIQNTSIKLTRTNRTKVKKAVSTFRSGLSAEFEKLYFIKNRAYFFKGAALTLLCLVTVVLFASDRGAALGLGVWLTGWSFGSGVLLLQVVRVWKTILGQTGDRKFWPAIVMTGFGVPFFVAWIFGAIMFASIVSPAAALILVLCVGLNIVFYQLLKAPTRLGRKVMDEIEGFKRYLNVAEKNRMEMLNEPQRTPQLFESFLPYALALDLEDRWSEKFADVLAAAQRDSAHRCSWYHGPSSDLSTMGNVATDIGSSLAGAVSAASASSSSSSGSGGGGSSGGGGGGGGGGGW